VLGDRFGAPRPARSAARARLTALLPRDRCFSAGYSRWALLAHVDLAERPTALIDAAAAADRAQRAVRAAAQHAARTDADRARRTAIQALTGPGRAAAHHVTATAATTAAQHRSERQRVQRLAPAEQQVNRRRRD